MYLVLAFVVALFTTAQSDSATTEVPQTTQSPQTPTEAAPQTTHQRFVVGREETPRIPTRGNRRFLDGTGATDVEGGGGSVPAHPPGMPGDKADDVTDGDDDNIYSSVWFVAVMVAAGIFVMQIVIFITILCVKNHMVTP